MVQDKACHATYSRALRWIIEWYEAVNRYDNISALLGAPRYTEQYATNKLAKSGIVQTLLGWKN